MIRVPASGPRNAKIAIIGMAPAMEETREGIPFVGPSGGILNAALRRHGLSRSDVFVTNVCDVQLPASGSLFDLSPTLLEEGKVRLRKEMEEVKPNVAFVLGGETMSLVCGPGTKAGAAGVMKWRGSILPSTLVPGLKCVVSLHPAHVIRNFLWKWEAVFRHIDMARAIQESTFPEICLPTRNAIISPTMDLIIRKLRGYYDSEYLSFDYETLGDMRVSCIGFGDTPDEAICIPFIAEDGKSFWSARDEAIIWKEIAGLLESDVRKIGQNLSFEWIVSWFHHILPNRIWIDTMLLHHALYPDFGGTEDFFGRKKGEKKPGHSLQFINSQYTLTPYYKDDRKLWSRGALRLGRLWEYNCKDVMVTLEAALKMWEEAGDRGLRELYSRFYLRPFPHTVKTEWEGIRIDRAKRAAIRAAERCEKGDCQVCRWCRLSKELGDLVGHPINVWSGPQMKLLLYNELGYEEKRSRKGGHVTADKATLEYFYAKKGDPRLKIIMEMRELSDYVSDVLDSPLDEEDRTHTHYKLGGTDGARWSSTKSILGFGTNLQNVPRKKEARSFFLP